MADYESRNLLATTLAPRENVKQSLTNLKAVEPDLGDVGAVSVDFTVDLLGGRDVGEEGDGRQPPPREVQARRRRHCTSLGQVKTQNPC